MKVIRFLILFFGVIFIFSCSSKKNILYVQDIDTQEIYSNSYMEYRVKVDDVLKIEVGSESSTPELALAFSSTGTNSGVSSSKETLIYNGYQVNKEGFINYPNLGKLKVAGSTIDEIRNDIYNDIIDKNILQHPFVDVKLLNAHFTILGEINKPGKYEYFKNNMNILEAIGVAGDLTINGMRKNIKLIRDYNGEIEVSSIDLTNKAFISGDNFQIFSGDIIIVNPNETQIKNAGIIGNSGTLLSLLSFLTSLIIIISN